MRIAREAQADPDLPRAFKRAPGDAGPDETTELIALWHKARRSLLKSRQHLLNEAESILIELPEAIRVNLPDTPDVRARLAALAERDRSTAWDPATVLRLRLLDDHAAAVVVLDAREKEATRELGKLTAQALDAGRVVRHRRALGSRAGGRGGRPPPLRDGGHAILPIDGH